MRVIPPIAIEPATFTRSTTATYLDSAGVLQTAAVDVPRFGYGYAQPASGPLINLAAYSEDFTTGWAQFNSSIVPAAIVGPYAGTYASKLVENTANTTHHIFQTCPSVSIGQQMTFWAVLKAGERQKFQVRFFSGGAFSTTQYVEFDLVAQTVAATAGAVGTMTAISDGFYLVTVTATAEASGQPLVALLLMTPAAGNTYTGNGTSGAYILRTQVNFGPTAQTYIATLGGGGYTAPALAFSGLLQESAATNELNYSELLDNAAWVNLGSPTVTANSTAAPNGALTADTLTDSSAAEFQCKIHYNAIPNDSQSWCFSQFIKKTTGGTSGTWALNFQITGGTTSLFSQVRFNTDLGIAIKGIGTSVVNVYDFGGYWRIAVAVANNSTGNNLITLTVCPATSGYGYGINDNVVATGSAVLWGAQVEAGTTPTSYIPTTAATVTRAADAMGTGMISSIPEPDAYTSELAWVAATNYTTGQRVARATTHRVYERLTPGGVDAGLPEASPTKWLDVQPDNRHAMFDLTDNTASVASGPIHVAIKSGQRANSLFLGGLVGTDVQTVVAADGIDDYTNQQNLRLRKTTGWYSYFFGGFAYRKAVALLDLPPLTTATVSVSILNTGAGGTACAAAVLGKNVFIGLAEYNAQRKARNFSTVTRDEFGKATLVKRRSIPTTQQTLWIEKSLADTILEMNELLNATPAAWLGLDEPEDGYFNALQIVGVYQEFDIDVSYPNNARVSLKLEEI